MSRSPGSRSRGGDPRSEGALEARREDILGILSIRFHRDIDDRRAELAAGLERIDDDDRLRRLLEYAVRCIDLYQFHQSLLPTSKLAAGIDPEVRREIVAEWARHYFAANLDLVEAMLEEEKQEKALHARRDALVRSPVGRFGYEAWTVRGELNHLPGDEIDELAKLADDCADLVSFHREAFIRSWAKQRKFLGDGPEARDESREAVLKMLRIRFGSKAVRLERDLDAIDDGDRLRDRFDRAARCASLGEFRERLST